jgi:hypothetical protein
MSPYTPEQLRNRFKELKFTWYNFHIIGVRAKQHEPDKFQDNIYVAWGNTLYCYSATTIPGLHWLQTLMNPAGTAIVVADKQYTDAYKLGLHKGNPALIQAKPLLVYRDNNRNNKAEEIGTPVTAGPECRIDIHGANKNLRSVLIGSWSAGCQVLNDPVQFTEFISLCRRTGLGNFTYTLLGEF